MMAPKTSAGRPVVSLAAWLSPGSPVLRMALEELGRARQVERKGRAQSPPPQTIERALRSN